MSEELLIYLASQTAQAIAYISMHSNCNSRLDFSKSDFQEESNAYIKVHD